MPLEEILKGLPENHQRGLAQGLLNGSLNKAPIPFDKYTRDQLAENIASFLEAQNLLDEESRFDRKITSMNKQGLYQLNRSIVKYQDELPKELMAHFKGEPYMALYFFAGLIDTNLSGEMDNRFLEERHTDLRLKTLSARETVAEMIYNGTDILMELHRVGKDREIYRADPRYQQLEKTMEALERFLPPELGHFLYEPGDSPESQPRIPYLAAKEGIKELRTKFEYIEEHLKNGLDKDDKVYVAEVQAIIDTEVSKLTTRQMRMLKDKIRPTNVLKYLDSKEEPDRQESLF